MRIPRSKGWVLLAAAFVAPLIAGASGLGAVQGEKPAQLALRGLGQATLEAQDSTAGGLFGFERTVDLGESAQVIARRAMHFWQDDDITVLTLAFADAEVLHA